MENQKTTPLVALIMGSQSDWETMKFSEATLLALKIPFVTKIISAHRTPERMYKFASEAQQNNFQIKKVIQNEYHGGSIRVYSQKSTKPILSKIVKKYIIQEKKIGIFNVNTYKKITKFIKRRKSEIIKQIKYYKSRDYKIVGIGAAAKANTLINTFKLDNSHIDFITDASKYKIGKFTPKSRIPIYNDKKLSKYKKICAILLTWNLKKQLKKKLISINKDINFIEVF